MKINNYNLESLYYNYKNVELKNLTKMKKILSIFIISTLLFISNLSFAQTSDETILIQLNNLQIKEIKQNPEEDILATFIVTKASSGFKCKYFQNKESERSHPCSRRLKNKILKSLRQGLKVNISEETELLDVNREKITIQDFKVGDKINVYGELDKQSYEIDALIVRKIGKGKIVPPPVTEGIKVLEPNGGEVFRVGETMTIKWNFRWSPHMNVDPVADISLKVFDREGKEVFGFPLANVPMKKIPSLQTYTYNWTIPPTLSHKGGIGFVLNLSDPNYTYKINIGVVTFVWERGTPAYVEDESDAPFSIVGTGGGASNIQFISPKGGEVWKIGDVYEIKWTGTLPPWNGLVAGCDDKTLHLVNIETNKEYSIDILKEGTNSYKWLAGRVSEGLCGTDLSDFNVPPGKYAIVLKWWEGNTADTLKRRSTKSNPFFLSLTSEKVFLGAIDSYTNHLIPEAIITFLNTGKSFRISEQEKIREYLKTLSPGRYDYKIQADGYKEMTSWLVVPDALFSVSLTKMEPYKLPFELTEEYLKPLRQPNMALIVGYVVDGDSHLPIEGAKVSIPSFNKSTFTNSRGFYWLNVPPMPEGGNYCKEVIDLIFSKSGYRTSKHLNVSKPTTKCGDDRSCLPYQLQLNSYLFSGIGDDVVYDHKPKLCQ
jgi:hypothetical protein